MGPRDKPGDNVGLFHALLRDRPGRLLERENGDTHDVHVPGAYFIATLAT